MEYGKGSYHYNLKDTENVSRLAKALSSQTRLDILRLLLHSSMSMTELSKKLYVSMSSISMHTGILEKADLITITPKPGLHGAKKLCGIKAEKICIDLFEDNNCSPSLSEKYQDIPIGDYAQAKVSAPCGIVTKEGYFEEEDRPYCFYEPEHVNAQLIWFMTGCLTYRISNRNLQTEHLKRVEISFEVCAEAPGYNNTWPSDIFLMINDHMITTFRADGDYGGTRGVNNPTWWRDSNTQFGDLKILSVTDNGVFLENQKVSKENIHSLKMSDDYYFTFSIGVDRGAKFPGGLNLFGKCFGNYAQNITIKSVYT